MSEPTKGPWRVEFDENDQPNIHAEREEFWIARLPHQCVGSIEQIQKANANLIAAAPDLLDACRSVVWWNERVGAMCEPEDERDVLQPLRAAIAKAEGRDDA